MKILYGTANPAKLQGMREILDGLGIDIVGLNDVDLCIDSIDENGNSPLENARIKALSYYKAAKMPVFSCDSGLYIDGIDTEDQPGVHVRRVNGKILNDEEMIEYYADIALKLGGEAKAKYKNAICLILDEDNIFEHDGEDLSQGSFLITSKPHQKKIIGFPLDSISLELETRNYYMDMDTESNFITEEKMIKGFRNFFIRAIGK